MPAANAATSQASAGYWPWSGNWYPQLDSSSANLFDNGNALALYDQYVQRTRGYNPGAQRWEYDNHRTTDPALDWAGHCHAWAAASILTMVPNAAGVTKGGVSFSQDALKGLVTELYYNPTYDSLPGGVRSNTDNPNAPEFQDLNPAWMHYLLQYYVGQYQFPFVMDTVPGSQVWNFPVFAYQSNSAENGDGSTSFNTRVWFSDASAGARNTRYFSKDYSYTLRNTGDGHMTGVWNGASVRDHPDFAWMPTGKQSGGGRNPRVDERIVEEILGYDV